MKINRKRALKLIWLLTNVACPQFAWLVMSLQRPQGSVEDPLELILFWAFVLAFPCSVAFFILFGIALILTPVNEFDFPYKFVLLGGFLIAGYLQWFHIIPSLFREQSLLTLDIAQTRAVGAEERQRRASQSQMRRQSRARLNGSPVVGFDSVGRTPLERVFDER